MNFLIYGAGALGQALGCMLAASGHKVSLVLRNRFIDAIEKKGLSVSGIMGEFHASGKDLTLLPDLNAVNQEYDYGLITTKTYSTAEAVRDIGRIEGRVASIVSMQNGCGNLEQLVDLFGSERSLAARVITGFEIASPGRIHITVTADAIHVGGPNRDEIPQSASVLAEQIDNAGHPCSAVEDIYVSLFAKLLYNCALNPLGAVLGVHYGALAEDEHTRQIMNRVIDETFAVIEGLGARTPWPSADAYKGVFYKNLIPATYNHRASMLQDLENGKPTEVDALVGYVRDQAKKLGVAAETCDTLASLVKFKEGSDLSS